MTPQSIYARGFTLVEMMVTVAVMSILLSVAVPSFQDASLSSQLRSTANNLVSGAHIARSEAFKRNVVVTLCVSSDGETCGTGDWEQGWIVMVTATATVIEKQSSAPNGLKITAAGGSTSIQFQPTGAGTTSDVFTVCRATPSVGHTQRTIAIDAAGRPSVASSTATTCG